MNTPAFGALFRDAIYQVLDNWVFRILAVLALLVVLATFVFGFRQDGIILLFGLEHWSYDGFINVFSEGGAPNAPADAQGLVIDVLLKIIFDSLAGNIGVIFCIAATAFFIPAMVQKGAADLLFHKPLPRLTFYLSRYFAGLVFVGSLATFMAVGIYLGFLLVSQYNDPGILLAAPLITYIFALVYAVSMCIGVLTRSTVASILLSTLFFTFNGCIHRVWTGMDQSRQNKFEEVEAGRDIARKEQKAGDDDSQTDSASSRPEDAEQVEGSEHSSETSAVEAELDDDESSEGKFFAFIRTTVTTLHYILPKTSDADVLAHKIRRAVNRPAFSEEGSLVSVFRIPDGFERVVPPTDPSTGPGIQPLLGDPLLTLEGTIDGSPVTYSLLRREAAIRTVERRSGSREVAETNSRAAASLRETLEEDGVVDVERAIVSLGSNQHGNPMGAALLRWSEEGKARQAAVFRGAKGKKLYTLWMEDRSEPSEERDSLVFETIHRAMGYDLKANSYEQRFTFTAPWRYNILFSVGSSLAFVVVLLLLGWWKLRSIEF